MTNEEATIFRTLSRTAYSQKERAICESFFFQHFAERVTCSGSFKQFIRGEDTPHPALSRREREKRRRTARKEIH